MLLAVSKAEHASTRAYKSGMSGRDRALPGTGDSVVIQSHFVAMSCGVLVAPSPVHLTGECTHDGGHGRALIKSSER